jgi:anti-sigma B factor antagonist
MALEVHHRDREGIAILDVQGPLTLGENTSEARRHLDALSGQPAQRVILNLAGVPYIDSTGLGTLVMAANAVSSRGGALKLLNLNRRNMELMVITKLTTVFEVFTDETDAVNSFYPDRKIQRFDILDFVREQRKPNG